MKRKIWMQVHLYLSLFFLPVAFIYALTGVLYIFEIRQNSGAHIVDITLNSMPSKGNEQSFMLQVLQDHNLKIPQDTTLKMMKGSPFMGNIKYSVTLNKNKEGKPILRTIDRGLYGILMLMHKSSGKKYEILGFKLSIFDFLAISFGISLMIFYLSGLIVTSFCKGKRAPAFGILGMGFILTTLAIYLSI